MSESEKNITTSPLRDHARRPSLNTLTTPCSDGEVMKLDADASPLHLHVIENARLVGKSASRSSSRSRARSRSHSRSRDTSPAISHSRSRRNSRDWSIEDLQQMVDPDILTDQKGHEELAPEVYADVVHNTATMGTLPSLNERMSDEALDDCHAFTDLKEVIRQISRDTGSGGASAGMTAATGSSNASMISSRSSENSLSVEGSLAGGSAIGDGGHLLETLEEFEEEEGSSGSENGSDCCGANDTQGQSNFTNFGVSGLDDDDDDDDDDDELTVRSECTTQTTQTGNISRTRKELTRLIKKRK